MLISIDHGNKLTKCVNSAPFTSGLFESDSTPFGSEILKYKGKYFQISDQRIPYHRDKTEDERFFVLTLFAIAREIIATNRYTPNTMRIQLAVGLPPAHFGSQYQAFTQYFTGRGPIAFSYQGKSFSVYIDEVTCYPQSYAAAVTILPALQKEPKVLILDIGGFTADYLQLRNGEGNLSVCDSLENGVILLYNKIISRVNAELDMLLDEAEIDAILRGQAAPSVEAARIVDRQARDFVNDLFSALRERGLELKTGKVIFVGGGANLLQRFIQASGRIGAAYFVEDIRANAKGYELLYNSGVGGV